MTRRNKVLALCTVAAFGLLATGYACHLSNVAVLGVDDIGGNQFKVNMQVCVGAGSAGGVNGADDNTFGIIFNSPFGSVLTDFTPSITSSQNGTVLTATAAMGGEILAYRNAGGAVYACIDAGCGPIQSVCTNLYITYSNAAPNSIIVRGIEAGQSTAGGCPITVYPNGDPCDGLAVTVDPPAPIVYPAYKPLKCVELKATGAGGSGGYKFKWSTGSKKDKIEVCPTATSTYQVTVTDSDGCVRQTSVTVTAIDVSCGNKMINVCHEGVTTCVKEKKVKEHLNHGDTLGECP